MKERQEFIAKLAEGYSTQSKTTNKFWVVLIVASIIVLVGRPDKEGLIDLPFTLGKVYTKDFYTINILLISIVMVAFSSAMIQTMRTRMLIQKAIDSLKNSDKFIGKVHIQDFFDSISTPTYSKVAPIAQFIVGKSQFFGDPIQNIKIRKLAKYIYLIFKISTFVFLYVIPIWALVICWTNKKSAYQTGTIQIPEVFLIFIMVLAGFSMFVLFIGEMKHIARASKKIIS